MLAVFRTYKTDILKVSVSIQVVVIINRTINLQRKSE
jgi:hypothetical protein